MTREQIYTEQLIALGVWEDAFAPVVKDLAKLERRRTRLEKDWSATVPKGGKPSFLDPLYDKLTQLDREILAYREALGLTPKALRKLRGVPTAASGPSAQEEISARLDRLLGVCEGYTVSEPDTGGDADG